MIRRLRQVATALRRTFVDGFRSPARIPFVVPPERMPPPHTAFARFGRGSRIEAPLTIDGAAAVEIGEQVLIDDDSTIVVEEAGGARLVIGDRTRIGPGFVAVCACGIDIGANVVVGRFAAVTDSWGWVGRRGASPVDPPGGSVTIGDDVSIGDGATVGPGVTVGRGAVIGPGAVVLDDVAESSTVFGNPVPA